MNLTPRSGFDPDSKIRGAPASKTIFLGPASFSLAYDYAVGPVPGPVLALRFANVI